MQHGGSEKANDNASNYIQEIHHSTPSAKASTSTATQQMAT